jgi:hypothetical protein
MDLPQSIHLLIDDISLLFFASSLYNQKEDLFLLILYFNTISFTNNSKQLYKNINFKFTTIEQLSGDNSPLLKEVPQKYILSQNFPNPFNPTTNIRFEIPRTLLVKLIVYDNLGREVATLVNEKLNAGSYEFEWNASEYPSGVYFYKLITDSFVETKKMVLLK